MQIQVIAQRLFENLESFEKTTVTSRWDRFAMVMDGTYTLSTDDGAESQPIYPNEIAFIPAATTVTRSLTAPLTYFHVSFMAQAEHPFRLALQQGKLRLPKEQTDSIFNSIKQAILMPNNQELIEHILEYIFVQNYLFGAKDQVTHRPLSEAVLRTIRYMNQHLHEKIDVDMLAARVYLSHSGLIWKFRQELNTTPSQYLILLRLRYAKQLLIDHDYNVTEIAEMCGYSNPYYFTNAFHRFSGMSPTDFRMHYVEQLSTGSAIK
ncbi:MAG: helix-turn-helix domain-containing protein [Ruminococcaceae bacterium]|nr:helix-turn-helix domain-containing protein [Oscillospiraceae bacterium]